MTEPRLTRRQFVCSSAATAVAFATAAAVGPDAGRAAGREYVEMLAPAPKTIDLKDYTPPAFLIPSIDLDVALFEDHARVCSRQVLQRNPQSPNQAAPLRLDGDALELESVMVDGRVLTAEEYALDAEHLSLTRVPNAFTLETVCRIRPQENTQLVGLYVSKNGFFTQCEPEGFRRITFFIDRPDVMARYTTTLHADKERYPVLLSNGNPIAREDEAGGRHWVRWEDPFPKPFALFSKAMHFSSQALPMAAFRHARGDGSRWKPARWNHLR